MKASLKEKLRALVSARASSGEIAFGVAVGVFVSFSPLYGLQILICLLLVIFFRRLNKPAVLLGVQASWVYPLMLYLDYEAGRRLLPGNHPVLGMDYFKRGAGKMWTLTKEVFHALFTADFSSLNSKDFAAVWNAVERLFPVMIVGWLVAGAAAAAITYLLAFMLLKAYRRA